MSKRLSIVLLMITLCFAMTGCGVLDLAKEAIADAKEQQQDQEKTNLLNNVAANSRSKETDDAMNKFLEKQKSAIDTENSLLGWGVFRYIPFVGANWKTAEANAAYEKFEVTAEADEVYQDSLLHGNGDTTGFFDKLIAKGGSVIFIILLIFAVIMFLIHVWSKHKTAKMEQKTAVAVARAQSGNVIPMPVVNRRAVENKRYNKTAISDEAYMRMISENCRKTGMNAQQLIAECNGNLEQAYQRSNLALAMKNN